MDYLQKRLIREIEDLENPVFFEVFNLDSHVFMRHYKKSAKELLDRIRNIKFDPDNIVASSRYLPGLSKQDICKIISKTLMQNINAVVNWAEQGYEGTMALSFDFPYVIGDAVVRGFNQKRLFSMSRNTVVICRSQIRERAFSVITSYPEFSLDEVDDVWDAIDFKRN